VDRGVAAFQRIGRDRGGKLVCFLVTELVFLEAEDRGQCLGGPYQGSTTADRVCALATGGLLYEPRVECAPEVP
jgi:hypothetical protein